ncbi:Cartilage-Associated Protein [Manis pentadactyla]|nr:Cartilage-Associated Protein [Manis pentadactyla]
MQVSEGKSSVCVPPLDTRGPAWRRRCPPTPDPDPAGGGGVRPPPHSWIWLRRTVCVQPCRWKEDEVVGLCVLLKGQPASPCLAPSTSPKSAPCQPGFSAPEPMSAAASPSERFVWST